MAKSKEKEINTLKDKEIDKLLNKKIKNIKNEINDISHQK